MSSVTCNGSALPPEVRSTGAAELVSDLVLVCTSAGPSQSIVVNIQLFLNVNLTSRITNPVTHETEALLLIDEPHPGVANISNGFVYVGQVLGTPGIPAGAPNSGNVYQAKVAAANSVVWTGVPYVTGGARIFRLTNIRANASQLAGGTAAGAIEAFVAMAGPISVTIAPAISTVGFVANALKFTSTVGPPNTLDLHFGELFATAFQKRIENTPAGPLTATHQDVPGTQYCTESGFTPEFSPVTPGAIGSASVGTRLLAHISNIPPVVTFLIVPNQVTAPSGAIVAHLVLPPYGPTFAAGTVTTGGGLGSIPVSALHTADVLYEVTAGAGFVGKTGCLTIDSFDIHATGTAPLGAAIVAGRLAPADPTPIASATAPEPRFVQ
jgi:hypothetical protein